METPGHALSKSDLAFMAVCLAGGEPLTPVQLQKSVFLMDKLLPPRALEEARFEFIPYNYGPFCQEIYAAAQHLAGNGLIEISSGTSSKYSTYKATPEALINFEEWRKQLDNAVLEHCHKIVRWVTNQTFGDLLRAIYTRFPEYREKSVFKF